MSRARHLLLAPLSIALLAGMAEAQDREHPSLHRRVDKGDFMSLPDIQRRVLPRMHGHLYLGPEFHPVPGIYRLKFLRGGRVVWIDVDARSGRIVGKSAP